MGIDKRSENRRMARVVEERAGVGTTEIVTGCRRCWWIY